MCIDINYNYLIEKNLNEWPTNFDIDERSDPDSISKKLYDDLKVYLFTEKVMEYLEIKSIENIEKRNPYDPVKCYYTLYVNGDEHLLSSDYIGSSVYWAVERNIKPEQIIDSLKKGRILGGHILWPRGFTEGYSYDAKKRQYIFKKNYGNTRYIYITINQAKGGYKGFYDRIDWTLVLLQIYFECMDNEKEVDLEVYLEKAIKLIPESFRYQQHIDRIKNMYYAFFNSKQWFQKFGSFKKICEVFALFDSFVDDKLNITLMADLFPILPIDYYVYINNICNAINKRNRKLYTEQNCK